MYTLENDVFEYSIFCTGKKYMELEKFDRK